MCERDVNNNNNIDVVGEIERSWADLPRELVSEIFSRVFVDRHQLVFCLVCKSWNSVLKFPTPTKQQLITAATNCSPLLFFTNNQLIHPILGDIYELQKFPDIGLGVQLCTAREDWLLFTQNPYYGKPSIKPSKGFFFNPFTKTKVWLPDLLGKPNSMWFNSPPTSGDWMVVIVRYLSNIIKIDTINCMEDRWTSCKFNFGEDSSFELSYCNPAIIKGKCYLFGKDSTLLIHDMNKKTFFLHEAPGYLRRRFVGEQYMLESDGKLLAVFVGTGGNWIVVCRWNLINRKWEKLESLGNKSLFVSRPYSMSIVETFNAKSDIMRNRIYFPRLKANQCLFYSLDTKRFHISDGSSFPSFCETRLAFSSTWIKPSEITLSHLINS